MNELYRNLVRISIAALMLASLMIMAAAPASAAAAIVTLPSSGPVGQAVTIQATGYLEGQILTAKFDGVPLTTSPATVTVPASGNVNFTITIPVATAGEHVIAVYQDGISPLNKTFTVLPKIRITSPPSKQGPVGTNVTVIGTGFCGAGVTADVTMGGALITSGVLVDNTGSFTANGIVPLLSSGDKTVSAADGAGNVASFTDTFTVTPTLVLSPNFGLTGSMVTVSGSGWPASSTVVLTFAGAVWTSVPSDVSGQISSVCQIPVAASPGVKSVCGSSGDFTVCATFTVVARPLTLTPTSGPRGTMVLVTGSHLTPGGTIPVGSLKIGGMAWNTSAILIDSAGTMFPTTLAVPTSAVLGANSVIAVDSSGLAAQGTFTVTRPALALNPVSGPRNSSIIITGTGWLPGATVTITLAGTCITVVPNSLGNIAALLYVPFSAVTGDNPVTAADSRGNAATPAIFTVPPAAITVSPTEGPAGSLLTIAGTGFYPYMPITIRIGGYTFLYQPLTDSLGAFAMTCTVPGLALGIHTVQASDGMSTATAFFVLVYVPPDHPVISLSPASGPPGSPFLVNGGGWDPGSTVTIYWYGSSIDIVTADPEGRFTAEAEVPLSAEPGVYPVTAQDGLGNSAPPVPFAVPGPILTLDPTSGPAGTSVTLTGCGFHAYTAISVRIGGYQFLQQPLSDALGNFSYTFTVPGLAPGTQMVMASDGIVFATTSFTIEYVPPDHPVISVNPTSGPPGSPFFVNGDGWDPGSTVTIYWDGSNIEIITADPDGRFTAEAEVPLSAEPGVYPVTAQDGLGNSAPPVPFAVPGPILTLAPTSGPAGTSVTLTGYGFHAYTAISVKIGNYQFLQQPLSDALGNFSYTFTVPGLAPGTQMVMASDGVYTATTAFIIMATPLSTATQLASISDLLIRAWGYYAGTWQMYDPADPVGSDLPMLILGRGYWIKVTSNCTLIYGGYWWDLSAGWNLIGWSGGSGQMAAALEDGTTEQILPPCRLHGSVQVNGAPVADGTVITATIEGDAYTATTPSVYGASTYLLQIGQPEGSSYSGKQITFKIGTYNALQTAAWETGGNIVVDLTTVITGTGLIADIGLGEEQYPDGVVNVWTHIWSIRDSLTGEPVDAALGCYQASAYYDPGCLEMLTVNPGDPPFNEPIFGIDNTAGYTGFVQYTISGADPPLNMAHLVPRLIGCALESCQLQVSFDVMADPDGNEILQNGPYVMTFQRGDVNGDGIVNIVDAMFGAQYLVGLRPAEDIHLLNMASVRHDDGGDVKNIIDCMYIAQYVVGLRDCYFDTAYRVGAVFSLTGPNSSLGTPQAQTVMMLAEEINAAGGINGHPLEVTVYDTGSDAQNCATLVNRLIEKDHVAAIIGPTTSSESLAIIDQVTAASTPLISCASHISIVTPVEERAWIFKTAPSTIHAVNRLYSYIQTQGITDIALLTDTAGFGVDGRNVLLAQAPSYGLNITDDQTYSTYDANVYAQLTHIDGTGAEVLICWGLNPGAATVATNRQDLEMTIPLFCSHGVANQDFIDLAGEAANGVILLGGKLPVAEQLPPGDPQREILLQYRSDFESRYGAGTASTYGGHAYDGLSMAVMALANVGPDKALIRDYLEAVSGFPGISGIFTMSPSDHNGLSEGCFAIIQIDSGAWALLE